MNFKKIILLKNERTTLFHITLTVDFLLNLFAELFIYRVIFIRILIFQLLAIFIQ